MSIPAIGEFGLLSLSMIKKKDGWPYRKDMGHIDGLADSMKRVGLLQAVGVDPSGFLIWGSRRIEAANKLGWADILCRVVSLDDPLTAMKEENENRPALSPSEMTAMIHAIEAEERRKAKERQERAQFGKNRNSQCSTGGGSVSTTGDAGKTRDKIGAVLGVSGKVVDALKKIDANGTPELKEAVEDGTIGKIDGGEVASEPAKVQNKAVEDVKKGKARTARAAVPRTKQGKPKFDDRKIKDMIGKLARLFNDRAQALGLQKSNGWKDVRAGMEVLISAWGRWQLEQEK